jgi:two-component system, NtrC family, sensor kinase
MNLSKIILKLTAMVLFSIAVKHTNAQQSRVDSAITLLNKSNLPNGPDSLGLTAALQLISTAVLTDAQIVQIEKAAEQFKKGTDEDIYYLVKICIIRSLTNSDKIKAIQYGKLNYNKLEKTNTLRSKYLSNIILCELRFPYRNSDQLIEGFQFFTEKVNGFKKNRDSLSLASCYYVLGGFYRTTGLYESALYNMKKSLSYFDTRDLKLGKYFGLNLNIGKEGWLNNSSILSDYYRLLGDYNKAIKNGEMMLKETVDFYKAIGEKDPGKQRLLFSARHIALAMISSNQLDSVDNYLKIAENGAAKNDFAAKAYLLQLRSLYNTKLGSTQKADSLIQKCWQLVNQYQINVNEAPGIIEPDYYLALLRTEQKKYTEAVSLLLKNIVRTKIVRSSVLRDYKLLAELYEKTGDNAQAKEAYKSFLALQESMLADQRKFQTISFETEQQMNEKELSISKLENDNKISSISKNFSIGIAALLLILAGSIYYRFQSKKKANRVLEKTLVELKSTQSQLIQSEKMASLGELTAGIAHEIQNPLNFVNNFSEVSTELVDEMNEEIDRGNLSDAKEIANDLKQNLEKINHHGKRAGDIVKGMLQHSRSSSGSKEPTDINKLADEYLRLAYHGLRAKDKSFNATLKTDYDESIGNINIIPQDIGRVILNLITNAFYVVDEKKKAGIEVYEPTVSVSTKKINDKIEIKVSDNGKGIPQKVLDKIFQPFFTTKPTGQGTGLGLSLSYDIVKAHGGELKVETKEGEGSTFIIQLPTN